MRRTRAVREGWLDPDHAADDVRGARDFHAVKISHVGIIVIDDQSQGERRVDGRGDVERPAEVHRDVAIQHVGQHCGIVVVVVAEAAGAAAPIRIQRRVGHSFPVCLGRIRALVMTPRVAMIDQRHVCSLKNGD